MLDRRVAMGLLWTALLLPATTVLAVWASLWMQWEFPTEDDIGIVRALLVAILAGIVIGLLGRYTVWTRKKIRAGLLIPAVGLACPLILSLPLYVAVLFWFFLASILVGFGIVGYWTFRLTRHLARRGNPTWRVPIAIALCPLLLVIAAEVPPLDAYKWLWPWTTFRTQLRAFHANAALTADRLGLPRDRALTPAQLQQWSQQSPMHLRLEFPLTHKTIIASVVCPRGDGDHRCDTDQVWLWWGNSKGTRTFGPLDLKWMYLPSGDD